MRFRTLHVAVDVNSGVSKAGVSGNETHARPPFWKKLFSFRAALSLLLIVSVSFVVGIFAIRANSVNAYPGTCLGGWQEPSMVAGIPESASGVDISSANSALLPEDTAAQIFCSGFSADIPPDTRVTGATLRFFIAPYVPQESVTSDVSAPENPAIPDETSQTTDQTEDEPLETEPSSDAVLDTNSPAPLEDSEPVPVAPTDNADAPPLESAPVGDPAAFRFIRYAEAEEIEVSGSYETGDTAPLDSFEETQTVPESGPDDAPEEGEVLGESTGPVPAEPFLEIAVTFDGVTWHTLRTLAAFELGRTEVSVPLPDGFDWHNLDAFQVSLRNIPTLSRQPGVLAEGMELILAYEQVPQEGGIEEVVSEFFGGGANPESADESEEIAADADEEGIAQPIIPAAPPRNPPVRPRVFDKTLSVDTAAPHSCTVMPFKVEAVEGGEYGVTLALFPGAPGEYEIDIGSLPAGVRVTVKGEYEYATTDAEREVSLSVSSSENADVGDFTVPVFYTEKKSDVSAVCQLNIVTAKNQ